MNGIAVFTNLTEGQQVKFTRLSKGLRQIDVASMAKVNLYDITAIEKDRYLQPTRRKRILTVLGLNGEEPADG